MDIVKQESPATEGSGTQQYTLSQNSEDGVDNQSLCVSNADNEEWSLVDPAFKQRISRVANVEGKRIYSEDWTLQQAVDYFNPLSPPIVTKEERDIRELFSCNIYKSGTTRGKQNVEAMTGVVFDFDNKEEFVPIQTVLDRLNDKRIIYFWYTSYSHTAERPRWRLIISFAQPVPVNDWNIIYDQMVILIGAPSGIDHQSCRDIAHIWFPPYKNPDQSFLAGRGGNTLLEPLNIELLMTMEEKAEYAKMKAEKQKSLPLKTTSVPLSDSSTFTFEQIKDALDYIDPSCEYPQWIRIGMALHQHFGGTNTGFDLWLKWSAKSAEKFTGKQSLLIPWAKFIDKPDKITAATIIHYAQEKGYVLYPDLGITAIDSREEQPALAHHVIELSPEDEEALEAYQRVKHKKSLVIENNVANVANVPESLTEKDFELATHVATLAQSTLQTLQTDYFQNENQLFYTKGIFVRDMNEDIKQILSSWYPSHVILKLPDEPLALETVPSFVKEVLILSSPCSDKEQKQDRYRKRLLHRQSRAVNLCYLPHDMRIEDFITLANEDSVKRLLNQALSALEIPSSFTAITDVNDLFKYQARETEFLIEGLLPTIGVSILAAHPKTGKSWMALNFIKAILSGQSVFGDLSTQNIGILYLSLEDNASRLKTRLQMVYEQDNPSIHNLKIQTRSKQFNDRTLAEFKEYLETNPDIKFVVIDPFEKIRPSSDKHSNAYQKDYKDMSALKNLAEELEISILLVHHLKKDKTSNDSDLSSLNGSMGLSGAADSILLLKKDGFNAFLKVTGKDIEDRIFTLAINPDNWLFSIDDAELIAIQGLQGDILRCLRKQNKPCRSKEIAEWIGKSDDAGHSSVRNQLKALRDKKRIECPSRGLYQLSVAMFATSNISNVANNVAVSNPYEISPTDRLATFATQNPPSPPRELEELVI